MYARPWAALISRWGNRPTVPFSAKTRARLDTEVAGLAERQEHLGVGSDETIPAASGSRTPGEAAPG